MKFWLFGAIFGVICVAEDKIWCRKCMKNYANGTTTNQPLAMNATYSQYTIKDNSCKKQEECQ